MSQLNNNIKKESSEDSNYEKIDINTILENLDFVFEENSIDEVIKKLDNAPPLDPRLKKLYNTKLKNLKYTF